MNVPNLDPILWEFLKNNFFFLTLIAGAFKALAILTPSAKDDKVAEMFASWLSRVRGGK